MDISDTPAEQVIADVSNQAETSTNSLYNSVSDIFNNRPNLLLAGGLIILVLMAYNNKK